MLVVVTSNLDYNFQVLDSELRTVKIPLDLESQFLQYAQANTNRDIETCGVLGGNTVRICNA